MAEYWLISAPGDKTPQQTYANLKSKMTGLSPVFQLQLPELKVMVIWSDYVYCLYDEKVAMIPVIYIDDWLGNAKGTILREIISSWLDVLELHVQMYLQYYSWR